MADDDFVARAQTPLDAIDAAAARYGLNPAVLKGIASIESSMDPASNRNRSTQYKGLFQIGQDEWKQYGSGDIYNPADNANAAAKMLADHAQWYRGQYGAEPTPGRFYMMHLQGRGFVKNGTMTNVAGNPYPGMRGPQTPESFEQGWSNELGRRMARYGGADSIYANGGGAGTDATATAGAGGAPAGPVPSTGGTSAVSMAGTPTTAPSVGSALAPPVGGVQAALAGLGSPSSGGGTFADIGKRLAAQADKTKGLPFPDAKLKPFEQNLRPLPLNLPDFAAMARIPKFAEGGIVDRPTVAMVGEDGPEAIVPLYGKLGSGETSDPFAAAAARIRAPYAGANARTSGLPEFIDYLKNRTVSAVTAPLDALTGKMQVSDPVTGMPTPEAMQRGQKVAGMAMTGAIPFAERGSAGVFGGRLSPMDTLREAAREAAQPGVKAGLPPPKNLFQRTWDNYTSRMSEPEALASEAVWGSAPLLAKERGISEPAAFAQIMNDWYRRKGFDRHMTVEEANAHMGASRGDFLLRHLLSPRA